MLADCIIKVFLGFRSINLEAVRLPLASHRFVLDLGISHRFAGESHAQVFTSLGTLFKLLGFDRGAFDTDELDHFADDLGGEGLLGLSGADLGAGLDLLDGNADLPGLLFNDVLAEQSPGQVLGALGDPLGQTLDGGGDDTFLDAFVQFAFVPGHVLAGDSGTGFLDHVGVGGEAGPGHHALPGGLEVGGVLVVEVAAETASASLEHLRGRDFDTFAIKENPERFLGEVDQVDIVFVPIKVRKM